MKQIQLLFSALLLMLLSACSPHYHTDTEKALAKTINSEENKVIPVDSSIVIGKLENGLTYYIRQNSEPQNRAELRLVVNAGSILEDENQQGLAHFAEHMAFNGTEHFRKQELVDYLEGIGMRFGPDLNAYTSFDETVYMLQVPTDTLEVLEKAFLILQDWAQGVSYEPEEIDKERGVIKEEWRLGRGAAARMRDKQFPLLFKGSQYAQRLPIGKIEVIDTFKHETLIRFFKDWYRPDLMAVVAVGDFDPEMIEAMIRSRFAGLTMPDPAKERKMFPVPDHPETIFAIATDPEATYNMISVYYKKDVQPEKRELDYRRQLVEGLYHRMLNLRFMEISRQPDPPFMNAFSGSSNLVRTKGVYMLGARVKEGKMPLALKTILTEARRVRLHGFTPSELQRNKTNMLRYMEKVYLERENTKSRSYASEYVRNFLSDEPIPGIEYEYELYQKFIPGISLEEVNALADKWMTKTNRTIMVSAPEKEGVPVPSQAELLQVFDEVEQLEVAPYVDQVKDQPLISQLPPAGKIIRRDSIPEIGVEEWTLSNGSKIVFKVTDFKNDQILFSGFSPGGTSLVPDSNYVAAMTAASVLMESGLGEFNRVELQKQLSGKIARVRPYISEMEEGFSGSASPADLEVLFQLLHLYFTAPRADSSAFLSYSNRISGYLENRKSSPDAAYSDTMQTTIFQNHFRTRPWSEQLLEEMDLEKSLAFYKDRFADVSDFTFFMVGNINTDILEQFATRYVASLTPLNRRETGKDVLLRYPRGEIQKTVIRGMEPKSKVNIDFFGDFEWNPENRFNISVLARVLAIKLREKIREDEGGTYGVSVWAAPDYQPVEDYRFHISFGCDPQRVDELMDLVFIQIDSLKNYPVSDIYLQKVKNALLRKHELNLRENSYWHSMLSFYYQHRENPRQVLGYADKVETISREMIRQAANRYLNEERSARFILLPEQMGE